GDRAEQCAPQDREAGIRNATRVEDRAVEVVDEPGDGDRFQVGRVLRCDQEPGEPRVRVSVDPYLSVRPRLNRDPVVDDVRAVLRRAVTEQTELSVRAAGPPKR